jgi:hypothetical protein
MNRAQTPSETLSESRHTRTSDTERNRRVQMAQWMRNSPIPDTEIWSHMGLYLNRQELSRIFYIHDLYKMILDVQGVVMEFGVRWGQQMALYASFRGMYEPFNYTRKIIGFDTFEGFPEVHAHDGTGKLARKGAFTVSDKHEEHLAEILAYHEAESPIPHLKKFELVKGDVRQTVPQYLKQHPETVIAFACFDLDLYEPTLKTLQAIKPHLVKGSVIWFDETNCPDFPGETRAVQEFFGLNNLRLRRSPHAGFASYVVVE